MGTSVSLAPQIRRLRHELSGRRNAWCAVLAASPFGLATYNPYVVSAISKPFRVMPQLAGIRVAGQRHVLDQRGRSREGFQAASTLVPWCPRRSASAASTAWRAIGFDASWSIRFASFDGMVEPDE